MKNQKISFNLLDFENDKNDALILFRTLSRYKKFKRTEEIDKFFSKQPSIAYKYVQQVLIWGEGGRKKASLSEENENVFIKNIKYAIAYLIVTDQKRFKSDKLQKRIEDKIYKKPGASFDYAHLVLRSRLPEEKEIIFLDDYYWLLQYSKVILNGGKFSEKLHKMLSTLATFENLEDNNTGSLYQKRCLKAYLQQDFSSLGTYIRNYYRY